MLIHREDAAFMKQKQLAVGEKKKQTENKTVNVNIQLFVGSAFHHYPGE